MSARIIPRPRRPHQCAHCSWLVPPGSVTEAMHHKSCTLPRREAAARAERIAAYRERCRQEARAKPPRRRGIGPRRLDGPAPLPAPAPSAWQRERLELLQAALPYPEMQERLTGLTRLPLAALERVAAGRSTLAPTAWRRLLVELGR